jgi:NTE family protein
MFGAYQAGAWKVLRSRVHPDIVIGASAGALNAWAIAGGAEPEELVRFWLDQACAGACRLRLSWRGIFASKPLHARIEALWKAYRPRTDVGIVAVELGRLRSRLFRNEEITWRHLAASCAVLTCYPQIRLDGRLYTDGGLLSTLPLWAAAAAGADRIIAVNALSYAPSSVVRAAVTAFRAVAPKDPPVAPDMPIRVIAPSGRLGTLREALYWNENAVRRFIALGEADAEQAARSGLFQSGNDPGKGSHCASGPS